MYETQTKSEAHRLILYGSFRSKAVARPGSAIRLEVQTKCSRLGQLTKGMTSRDRHFGEGGDTPREKDVGREYDYQHFVGHSATVSMATEGPLLDASSFSRATLFSS